MKPQVMTVTMNPALDKTVTVESVRVGELNRIKEVRTDAGGKGINVAKVLKHFDTDVYTMGICAGSQGVILQEKLRDLGIQASFIETNGETRINMKVVDQRTKQTTEFNEPGLWADAGLLKRFADEFTNSLEGISYVVLGGSLPPGAPADYYKKLILAARSKGVRTILDADGEAFARGLEAVPYAVKPNIHELEAYLGRKLITEAGIVTAAKVLISQGVQIVQVSMGREGSLLVAADEAYRAKPFPITPLSTVGAGDSMVAAMVYGFMKGMTPEGIARWTSAAGTVTASKAGTQVCTMEEVQDKLDEVHLACV